MTDATIEFGRGLELIGLGGGLVSHAVLQEAFKLAGGDVWLLTQNWCRDDGWRLDGMNWHVPPRDPPPEETSPMRTGAVEPTAPAARSGGQRVSEASELAALTDDELVREIEAAEAYERWRADPDERRRRWDRRVLCIGRALRAKSRPGA